MSLLRGDRSPNWSLSPLRDSNPQFQHTRTTVVRYKLINVSSLYCVRKPTAAGRMPSSVLPRLDIFESFEVTRPSRRSLTLPKGLASLFWRLEKAPSQAEVCQLTQLCSCCPWLPACGWPPCGAQHKPTTRRVLQARRRVWSQQ